MVKIPGIINVSPITRRNQSMAKSIRLFRKDNRAEPLKAPCSRAFVLIPPADSRMNADTPTIPTPLIQKAPSPPISHCKGLTHGHSRIQLCAMHADNKPPKNDGKPQTAPEQKDAPEATPEATPEAVQDTQAMDPWEELEAEAARWKEISLRTAAEIDNLRKRTAREREDAIRYANQRLLEELLPVIDNFEMGMQAASQDTSSMIYIGMDMVRRQLQEFLTSQGVEEIPTTGLFDPNLHDAVAQEDCSAGEEGRILKVTRRGYKLRDRLLRPASVVVSKLPAPVEGGTV